MRPEDFQLRPGVLSALSELSVAGFHLILVSNQPNAAKGKCTLTALEAVHDAFVRELAAAGIEFDAFCYAYGHPGANIAEFVGPCPERKPGTLFLEREIERLHLERSQCWMVGDRDTDIECGCRAGVHTIHVASAEPDPRAIAVLDPEFRVADLPGAVKIICGAGIGS
jgi:D-glycero-D-manno-heptose 1,7-bisphosphate phosphatase